jgi:opacity protein-like surface antigen
VSARITLGWVLAALLVCATPASGQDDADVGVDYMPDGWFMGVGATYGIEDFQGSDLDDDHNEWGGNIYAGWRFMRYWAGDLTFEYIDDYEVSDANVSGFNNGVRVDRFYSLTLNGRGYLPLDKLSDSLARIQPYASAGFGLLHGRIKNRSGASDSKEKGRFTGRLGGGLDISLTENLVFNASANYFLPTSALSDLDFLSVGFGLGYRFGGGD